MMKNSCDDSNLPSFILKTYERLAPELNIPSLMPVSREWSMYSRPHSVSNFIIYIGWLISCLCNDGIFLFPDS